VLRWPLSDLFEEIVGIGADSYVIVSLVSLVYATVAGGIVTLLALLAQFWVRRRSRDERDLRRKPENAVS